MQGRTGTDDEQELMPVKANRNDPQTPLLQAANISDRGRAGAQEENAPAVLPKAATALIRAGSAAAHATSGGRFGRSGEPRPSEAGRSPERSRRETSPRGAHCNPSVKSKMFRDSIDSNVKRFGCTRFGLEIGYRQPRQVGGDLPPVAQFGGCLIWGLGGLNA
jgi:hypothetical protein